MEEMEDTVTTLPTVLYLKMIAFEGKIKTCFL